MRLRIDIFILVTVILIAFVSCKTARYAQVDSDLDHWNMPDSIPEIYITRKGDTLYNLTTEVDIEIFRVLKDTVIIMGVGDIMMGTNYPKESYLPDNGGKDLWDDVNEILKNADVTFGNLEGVILDKGGQVKYCKNPRVCYAFRTPESYLSHLTNAGFDVMSTANNHAGDFGDEGRKNTVRCLDSVGIASAGLLLRPTTSFEIEGMKYGFAAFAPNTGTQSILDIATAEKLVKNLDSLHDIVIVSFHGGAEGKKHQHVPKKTEVFYGENRGNVYKFAHAMIDAGADIIFGHGPHVTRAMEIYQNRFIAYSLGNFCTYGRFNLNGPNGVAPIVKLYTNHKGEFLAGKVISTKQIENGPILDKNQKVVDYINKLIAEDFPELKLTIDDTGNIIYIQN